VYSCYITQKCLTTPETVPFRLTRDIVDGMGPSGTEGIFTRSAEATAAVLRDNANALLTILSAVVSDPLYKWNVSPVKARQCQMSDEERQVIMEDDISKELGSTPMENENDAASRAIAKIHEKLQGYEDGTSGEQQSVEGQVQLLINSARDPDNLCALYFGWCPWL
jgi:ataxia telangiectasia mutated family protein